MDEANIIIGNNSIRINNLDKLLSFSKNEFFLIISNTSYVIKGEDLSLDTINQETRRLNITGNFLSIHKTDKNGSVSRKKDNSFLKKIFK